MDPRVNGAVAERLVDVIQSWLLLTAPADPIPYVPMCFELRSKTRSWSFSFDGQRWTASACVPATTSVPIDETRLLLALAGRSLPEFLPRPVSAVVDRLKVFLPGP